MGRPPLEVADLIRAAGQAFIERSRPWISWKHLKVLLAIERCRTAALGGHLDECTRCGHRAISYNSCRNRHCPKCQAGARDRWLEERRRELLPTRLRACGLHAAPSVGATGSAEQEGRLRSVVSHQCGNTSRSCSRSPTSRCRDRLLQRSAYLESETRTSSACPLRGSRRRTLRRSHALDQTSLRLLSPRQGARSRFSRQVCRGSQARLPGRPTRLPRRLATPGSAKDLLLLARPLFRNDWVVYSKRPFGGPEHVLQLSGPLHPSRSHLQPSPGLLCG